MLFLMMREWEFYIHTPHITPFPFAHFVLPVLTFNFFFAFLILFFCSSSPLSALSYVARFLMKKMYFLTKVLETLHVPVLEKRKKKKKKKLLWLYLYISCFYMLNNNNLSQIEYKELMTCWGCNGCLRSSSTKNEKWRQEGREKNR